MVFLPEGSSNEKNEFFRRNSSSAVFDIESGCGGSEDTISTFFGGSTGGPMIDPNGIFQKIQNKNKNLLLWIFFLKIF